MFVVKLYPKILNVPYNLNFSSLIIKSKHIMPKAAMQGKRKKANGYEFPDPLPLGLILKDVSKKEWCLGSSIGKGGFGEIYAACEVGSKSKIYPFAIKVEPHENGPLFVERSFFLKVCKPEKLEEWKKKKNMDILGVPSLQGFGSHMHNNKNYRFIVMDRFGKDLWSLFLENKKVLTPHSSFTYALQILDALEYIHSTGYVHADIKGANLLFGFSKGTENNLFLVDFGLACKYSLEKEFKRNPKRAHDGTIEYTSRDFHQGVPTRRGDMEILGYNLLHWLHSSLPWENAISKPQKVFEEKNAFMLSVKAKLNSLAPKIPSVIIEYLEYVSKLDHLEEPDYNKCRNMFKKALTSLPKGRKSDMQNRVKSSKSPRKRKHSVKDYENIENENEQDAVTNGVESESDDIFDSPKKIKSKSPHKKGKANWRNAPKCEPGNVVIAKRSRKKANDSEPSSSSESIKIDISPIKSWRDCPTVRAGNIAIAGQYTKKTSTTSRKSKK